mmetsp:Transcript_13094/g.17978  ORF Transcript_13094/g.17978 Transcript_13094/m.17978 type:complete len:381 (+) Transcript_13094:148-1290(+)
MEELDSAFTYVKNAHLITTGEKKGNNEDIKRYLGKATDAIEDALIDFDEDDSPKEKFLSRWLFAYVMATRAKYETADAAKLLNKGLTKIAKCAKHAPTDEDVATLHARILINQADLPSTNLVDREKSYIEGSDILLNLLQHDSSKHLRKSGMDLLKHAKEYFQDGEKSRERNGFAVYRLSGEFWKEGGEVKSWKHRYFVLDDSYLCYYSGAKEWEAGPVKGAQAKPKGIIELWEIRDVSIHNTTACPTVPKKPPKTEDTYCLHIQTAQRLYNILGFSSKEQAEKWMNAINFAVKFQRILKTLKVVLKDPKNDAYDEVENKFKTFEPLYKEFKKKEREEEKKMKERRDKKKKEREEKKKASESAAAANNNNTSAPSEEQKS